MKFTANVISETKFAAVCQERASVVYKKKITVNEV